MKDSNDCDVSFIVPARDEAHRIGACLAALARTAREDVRIEVLVLDNGSADATVTVARAAGARVYECPGLTLSALRNAGAVRARAPLLGFVDSDVLLESDWLEHGLREIAPEEVGMCGASPGIPSEATWVTRTWHLQIEARPAYGERPWLASMSVLVDRAAFDSVGGFDERLVTCEDVDFGYRLSRKYRIVNDARMRAVHLGEATTLAGLFRKEVWRGTSSYAGALRHRLDLTELPSLLLPLITLGGACAAMVAASTSSAILGTIAGLTLLAYPGMQSLRIAARSNKVVALPALVVVWFVYACARTWSAMHELREGAASLVRLIRFGRWAR